ncbi:MAG: hypothetical protein LBM61_08160 [Prevotellaceae bacterium]|jgi:hypothetical protein|nr:hypothetical protein [Prevotellaceae bacterium]
MKKIIPLLLVYVFVISACDGEKAFVESTLRDIGNGKYRPSIHIIKGEYSWSDDKLEISSWGNSLYLSHNSPFSDLELSYGVYLICRDAYLDDANMDYVDMDISDEMLLSMFQLNNLFEHFTFVSKKANIYEFIKYTDIIKKEYAKRSSDTIYWQGRIAEIKKSNGGYFENKDYIIGCDTTYQYKISEYKYKLDNYGVATVHVATRGYGDYLITRFTVK